MLKRCFGIIAMLSLSFVALANPSDSIAPAPAPKKSWFDLIQLRGYAQLRYNRLLETNPDLKCEQCDRSWGEGNSVFLRRGRMIFFGDVHDRVYMYVQFDYAVQATSSSQLHFLQVRDAYFDLALDAKKEFRIRAGQSKVPFGYENMQSSQNRLPLDRADALNSAVPNERDMGVYFMWAPESARETYRELTRDGMKGSGDYGVFAIGLYNGQTANRAEQNDQMHAAVRFSWPFKIGNQVFEPGVQAYAGRFVLTSDQVSSGVETTPDREYDDQRAAITLSLQPRPFGILAEYNIGTSPEFDPATNSIVNQDLQGGFVTMSYMLRKNKQIITPFVRAQYFDGGKKMERDARSYTVHEYEAGIEWLPLKNFELTAMYTISDRRYEDAQTIGNHQSGNLLRLQLQFNY